MKAKVNQKTVTTIKDITLTLSPEEFIMVKSLIGQCYNLNGKFFDMYQAIHNVGPIPSGNGFEIRPKLSNTMPKIIDGLVKDWENNG